VLLLLLLLLLAVLLLLLLVVLLLPEPLFTPPVTAPALAAAAAPPPPPRRKAFAPPPQLPLAKADYAQGHSSRPAARPPPRCRPHLPACCLQCQNLHEAKRFIKAHYPSKNQLKDKCINSKPD
jgi:hypothetical protein